jgi:hypothetical protein
MRLDTTAASNPGVVKRVLAIEDEAGATPEPAHAPAPSAASKCPDCRNTMLNAVGCTYCTPANA